MDFKDIQAKRQKLADAKVYLKSLFIGLDDIIDQIIDNMEAWYLMPDMINRPIIINLWGLTGVGKTDLVRKLVKFFKFTDKYLEIQMDTKSTYHKSIKSILLDSNIEEGEAGVILLDEIQRFRSIDDTGKEIFDKDFQDVWMLLSDGKFSGTSAKSELIEEVMNMMYSKELKLNGNNDEEDELTGIKKQNTGKKLKPHKLKFKMGIYRAKHLKKLARLKESVEEIMGWNEDIVLDKLTDLIKNGSNSDFEVDYSKCLIFVSGNIDEAYAMSNMVEDADIDANTLHAHSKKINVINIKKALQKRFKPEQIARFGNTHILYPSLSSENYRTLINKCLKETLVFASNYLKISKVEYEDSIVDFIYRNGVYPAQGVRPVFSTVNSIFNNTIPKIILYSKENNLRAVKLAIIDKTILVIEGTNFRLSLNGVLDNIKRDINDDKKTLISVHECGHAIVYAYLFGVVPQEIKSSISSFEGGYTLSNKLIGSKQQILNNTVVRLAGQAAEEIVFGESYKSNGVGSDINKATSDIMTMLRRHGLGKNISLTVSANHEESSTANVNAATSERECEKLLIKARTQAIKILRSFGRLLKETSTELFDKGSIEPNKFQSQLAKHGINAKIVSPEVELTVDYKGLLKRF